MSLDTGGTASSVTVNSSTSLTFTLTTDNTAAAVGTRTVKVTNPNGKFAYGTMTITTSAINVISVTPSPINTSYDDHPHHLRFGLPDRRLRGLDPGRRRHDRRYADDHRDDDHAELHGRQHRSSIGTWAATVTNPDGNSDSANFAIQKAPITLTAISPSTMVWGSTRTFTLTGTGFNSGAQVTLDGCDVTETCEHPRPASRFR